MLCFVLVAQLTNAEHRLSQSNNTLVWLSTVYLSNSYYCKCSTKTSNEIQKEISSKELRSSLGEADWDNSVCLCLFAKRSSGCPQTPEKTVERIAEKYGMLLVHIVRIYMCVLYINVCQIMCMLLNAFVSLSEKIYTYKSQMLLIYWLTNWLIDSSRFHHSHKHEIWRENRRALRKDLDEFTGSWSWPLKLFFFFFS